jgi:hypothetical protein
VPVGSFQEVGECRHSSNGVYYARIKSSGKEIRRSQRPLTLRALLLSTVRLAIRAIDLVSEPATVQPSWFLLANAR